MKKDMPLEELRWSCDSGFAHYYTPHTAVLGRVGGKGVLLPILFYKIDETIKKKNIRKMKDKSIYSKYKIKSHQDFAKILQYEDDMYKQYMYPHLKDYVWGLLKRVNVT